MGQPQAVETLTCYNGGNMDPRKELMKKAQLWSTVDFRMGLKFVLTEIVHHYIATHYVRKGTSIRLHLDVPLDEALFDLEDLDAFYRLYEAMTVEI
jgi:hypothetical protein